MIVIKFGHNLAILTIERIIVTNVAKRLLVGMRQYITHIHFVICVGVTQIFFRSFSVSLTC